MMQQFCKQSLSFSLYKNDQQGVVLPFFVLTLGILLFFAGLALDAGNLYIARLQAQKAADTATLAGLAEAIFNPNSASNTNAEITGRASTAIQENLKINGIAVGTQKSPLYTGPADNHRLTLEPTARVSKDYWLIDKLPMLLGHKAGAETFTVEGVARGNRSDANIVLLLDTSLSMGCPNGQTQCDCRTSSRSAECEIAASKLRQLQIAVNNFISLFDQRRDRIAVITFGSAASVLEPSNNPPTRGFPNITDGNSINAISDLIDTNPSDGLSSGAIFTSITSQGNTNICDAMYRAYEDMADVIANRERVNYVLFSDGAPTAARFLISPAVANPNQADLPQTNDNGSLGLYDYQQYGIYYAGVVTSGTTTQTFNYQAPSQLVRWDTLAQDYEVSTQGNLLVTGSQVIPNCSVLSTPFNNPNFTDADKNASFRSVVNNTAAQRCLVPSQENGNVIFRYHMPNIRTSVTDAAGNVITRDDAAALAATYGDINVLNDYGTRWHQLFYDCAVQTSDFLRSRNGVVWTVGLGNHACIGNDPYQNIDDTLNRKDVLLTRIAQDYNRAFRDPIPDEDRVTTCKYKSYNIEHPSFTRIGGTQDFQNNRQNGEYLSTTNSTKLTELFRQIAIKIQLRLIK